MSKLWRLSTAEGHRNRFPIHGFLDVSDQRHETELLVQVDRGNSSGRCPKTCALMAEFSESGANDRHERFGQTATLVFWQHGHPVDATVEFAVEIFVEPCG